MNKDTKISASVVEISNVIPEKTVKQQFDVKMLAVERQKHVDRIAVIDSIMKRAKDVGIAYVANVANNPV